MLYCDWDVDDWDTLIFAICHNNCILMLGPDAATEEVRGKRFSLTEILARELAKKIGSITREKINPLDLAQVAQDYCLEKGRMNLENKVLNFYTEEDRKGKFTELHRDLAYLPFYFVVTVTHDNMFYNALQMREENKVQPAKERYNFKGNNPKMVKEGKVKKPMIFYLFGSVEEPGSMVLTENDLLDFLVGVISNERPLPSNVLSELQREDKCFLFLGFGFRHWYLRILLHVLQVQNKNSPSFAVEQSAPVHTAQSQQTVFFLRRVGHKIHILNMQFYEFAAQMREKFEERNEISPECKRGWTEPRPPEVFICHASENKDYATFLYKELEEAGLKPWLDRENLRGGDEWESKIEETIKKVDYFVVLQSKALEERSESYVFVEIDCAFARQKRFRKGIRFIIPLRIDDCALLNELEKHQTIDLTKEKNIEKLIDTMNDDFKKRRGDE